MKTSKNRITLPELFSAMVMTLMGCAAAKADLINPSWLSNSIDGPSTTVQQRLLSVGLTSSVGIVAPDFGDQSEAEWFTMCPQQEAMQWSIAWQAAGQAPNHALGFFTVANPTPSDITWVIGGSNSGLPSSAPVSLPGVFGLAFNSGDNGAIYYSVKALNSTERDHLVVINKRTEMGLMERCEGVYATWEDNFRVDNDYNDFGLELRGTFAVPNPGAAAMLGLAGLASLRRRRNA